MSRRAAEAGFRRFLDPTMEAVRREFSVGRALRGTGLGPGGHVVDRLRRNADTLERRLVGPEFDRYRERSLDQFGVLLDAVERGEPIESVESQLLAHDSYVEALDPSITTAQRRAVIEAILERLDRLGWGIEPIVKRPEDDFWAATVAAMDRPEALSLVENAFPFTGPLRSHRSCFCFEVRADPNELLDSPFLPTLPAVQIEYTSEAIRAMTRAERQVIAAVKREVEERFEASDGG